MKVVNLAILAGWWLGCTVASVQTPRHLETGRHPSYPPAEYVTGSGSSTEGRAAAEVQARTEVCRQVRSRIEATTEDESVFVSSGGRSEVITRFVQRSAQTARCDYGERVRVVPELGAVSSGTYWAFAVLSREEAVRALRPDFDKDAGVFRERAQEALSAKGDPIRFTAQYNEAVRAFDRALPRGLEIRSIAGGRFEPLNEILALYGSLLRAASEVRSRLAVDIRVDGGPDRAGLERALARFLGASGIRASVGAAVADGLVLRVSAAEDCSMRLEVCCTLTLSATLCDADGARCGPVSLPAAQGCHRADREAARQRILDGYGGAAPARMAAAVLSGVIPVLPE